MSASPSDPTPRPRRILAVASGGGHWIQLLRLKPAFTGESVTWVTVDQRYHTQVGTDPFHVVSDATRWNRFGVLRLALQIMWLMLRTRPDVVVTTGAAPGLLAVMAGRLFGARTIWLDSLANVDTLSLSGRKARRWSTLWLTQWPELATRDGAHFEGAVV